MSLNAEQYLGIVRPNPHIAQHFVFVLLTIDVPWLACKSEAWRVCCNVIFGSVYAFGNVMLDAIFGYKCLRYNNIGYTYYY